MTFAQLTQVALLGTERQALNESPPATALGHLQQQTDFARREHALLTLAALSAQYERVGALPAQDLSPLPEPSAPESQPGVGPLANSLLQRLLAGECAELLPEWLHLATQAGQVARPETLPALLDLGQSKPERREQVLPVLGHRGHWLAAQNPDWGWAGGAESDLEEAWQTGQRPARLLALQQLRRKDAGRARDLLHQTWKQETPEDRALFVGVLESGLSLGDEDFLESALDDKRKEVRKRATALLARLPGSKLGQRMWERAQALLKYVQPESPKLLGLRRGKPAGIEIVLPAECDKSMQRDGIEPKPPQGFGEKAWWLVQMLELTPLETWTREWKVCPAEIIAASQQSEWKSELLESWTRAAQLQQNPEWADLLFAATMDAKRFERVNGLLGVLSPAQRETKVMAWLSGPEPAPGILLAALVSGCPHAWSPEFSRAVLKFMRRKSAEPSGDWTWRNQFKLFAPRLAPEILAEAHQGWPAGTAAWEFWSKGVDDFLAVVQFRIELHVSFTPQR